MKTERAEKNNPIMAGLMGAMLALAPTLALAADAADPNGPESPATILAGQIRQQGHPCDKSLSATRDPTLSTTHQPVWVLVCSNATYQITLRADQAASVEVIGGGQ
ncbi:hypothetical protein [Hypericibacter sp.]|uniref:hypothetical protein n=1 Tax=Hypericibacter sp. TaxID=2705401 RepID=UPI003D6D3485